MNLDEVKKAISIAKITIMSKPQTAFLANVACSLPTEVSEECNTAATDGRKILINPNFFMELDKEERAFLIAHETLHVVYMHMARLEWRDPKMFNKAADYVINDMLINQGFKMPSVGLHDSQYAGMHTEEVYRHLEDIKDDTPNGMDGDIQYQNNMSPDEIKKLEDEIQDIIVKSAMAAEMQGQPGSIPGSIQRQLSELTKPKVNWKVVLRRFMQSLDVHDYTWRKPRKRLLPHGLYMPSMYSEGLSKITFAIDTSGSITTEQFNQFLSEVHGVMKQFKPQVIEVMQFDHILQGHDIIKSVQDLRNVQFRGHGGTNPDAALEVFNTTNSMALIVITDGEFYTPQTVVDRPVFWVVFNNKKFKAPYGKVVHFEL